NFQFSSEVLLSVRPFFSQPHRPRLQWHLARFCNVLNLGVSRSVLLASAITARKSTERKQRTYRSTSLRGEFAFSFGCFQRPCLQPKNVGHLTVPLRGTRGLTPLSLSPNAPVSPESTP